VRADNHLDMAFGDTAVRPGWTVTTPGLGHPQGQGEHFVVPGAPVADPRRPLNSPGRVPVGESAPQAHDLLEQIEAEKRGSVDFQLIERMLYPEKVKELPAVVQESPPLTVRVPSEVVPAQPPGQAAAVETSLTVEVHAEFEHVETSVSATDGSVVVGEFTYERVDVRVRQETITSVPVAPQKQDPLALDLDGNGLKTSGVAAGVQFDLNADGHVDRASVATGGDALLALDRNANGRIDDGRELFGDQNGDANGFAALSVFDDNRDGRIDAQDAVYSRLQLLSFGADGSQQLAGLVDAGVRAISLGYQVAATDLASGDSIREVSGFERLDGSRGTAADLLLGFSAIA
jgi:hypothetical protein